MVVFSKLYPDFKIFKTIRCLKIKSFRLNLLNLLHKLNLLIFLIIFDVTLTSELYGCNTWHMRNGERQTRLGVGPLIEL